MPSKSLTRPTIVMPKKAKSSLANTSTLRNMNDIDVHLYTSKYHQGNKTSTDKAPDDVAGAESQKKPPLSRLKSMNNATFADFYNTCDLHENRLNSYKTQKKKYGKVSVTNPIQEFFRQDDKEDSDEVSLPNPNRLSANNLRRHQTDSNMRDRPATPALYRHRSHHQHPHHREEESERDVNLFAGTLSRHQTASQPLERSRSRHKVEDESDTPTLLARRHTGLYTDRYRGEYN